MRAYYRVDERSKKERKKQDRWLAWYMVIDPDWYMFFSESHCFGVTFRVTEVRMGAPLLLNAPDRVSRAYHFFDNVVDAHCCVRDALGFTVHWLVAFHWVRVRVRVYVI